MRRIVWADAARNDLTSIEQYWPASRPDYAANLIAAAASATALLLDQPDIGAKVGGGGLRKWRLRSLPYLLLYRVVGDEVRIDRVHHVRQDWRPPA